MKSSVVTTCFKFEPHTIFIPMTPPFLPELQESFGDDDESTSWSSSPRSSCSSFLISSEPLQQQGKELTKVLIIGATSPNGHEIIRRLSEHPSRPHIHAFCDETSAGLPTDLQDKCSSIIEGSIRHAIDLEEAIENTGVNWVLLCGEPLDSNPYSDMNLYHPRTTAAKNLATVLSRPRLHHIRVMVVSRIGLRPCPFRFWCIGMLIPFFTQRDREEIVDCRRQEEALRFQLPANRISVIRTTTVVSSEKRTSRKLVELTPQSNITFPMRFTHRSDLASCVAQELCSPYRECRTIHIASLN